MELPADVRNEVEAALGKGRFILRVQPIHGGCITPVARLDLRDSSSCFLKYAEPTIQPLGFFHAEAKSLRALTATRTVRIPEVLDVGDNWLLLEWLEPGRGSASTWSDLGRSMAALHRFRGEAFGWQHDNWIGSLPQANSRQDRWFLFWRDERLAPQWQRARESGFFTAHDDAMVHDLFAALADLLAAGDTDGPSLLHGDLWNGNTHIVATGEAAILDPSCYYGHREVDLAMASLFGGFSDDFFAAYNRAWPLAPGWRKRRHAYQLYYLLVHVNLFGASYVGGARSAIRASLD